MRREVVFDVSLWRQDTDFDEVAGDAEDAKMDTATYIDLNLIPQGPDEELVHAVVKPYLSWALEGLASRRPGTLDLPAMPASWWPWAAVDTSADDDFQRRHERAFAVRVPLTATCVLTDIEIDKWLDDELEGFLEISNATLDDGLIVAVAGSGHVTDQMK